MKVGSLLIDMAADLARLRADMNQAGTIVEGAMRDIAKSVSVAKLAVANFVGGAMLELARGGAGAFIGFIKGALQAGDEMSKFRQKTGLAAEQVAGLQLAARQAGVNDMAGAMAKLSKNMAAGNDAFEAMGVKVKNADGSLRGTREVLGDVAAKFAGYQDGAAKAALAQELFGKTGAELIPLLNAGADGLDEMDATAARLGLTMSEETQVASEKFNDTVDLLGQGVQGVGRKIAANLLPTLNTMAGEMLRTAGDTRTMTEASSVLASGLKILFTVAAAGVGVFNVLGKGVGAVAAALVLAAQGEFRAAWNALKDGGEDISATVQSTVDRIGRVWDGVQDTGVSAMAALTGAAKTNAPIIEKNLGGAAKKVKDEFADLLNKLNSDSAGVSPEFGKELAELHKGLEQGRISLADYIVLVQRLIGQQKFAKDAAAAEAKAFDELFDAQEKARLANEGQIKSARQTLENIQFETRLLTMNTRERAVATAMRELERQGVVAGTQAYEAYAEKIRAAIFTKDATEANIAAQKEIAEGWKRTSEEIGQQFTDALIQGGATVGQALKRMFQNMVLRPIIQPIMTSVGGMIASFMGMLGLGGGSAMAGQGGGGAMGVLNMASSVNTGINFFSGVGSWLGGGSAGAMFSNIGAGIGLGFNTMLSQGPLAAINMGTGLIGAGSTGGGLGTILGGAALPALGVGLLLNGLGLFRSLEKRGDVLTGTLGQEDGVHSGNLMRRGGTLFSGPNWYVDDTGVSAMDKAIQTQWDASIKVITDWSKALGLSTDKIDGFTTTLGSEKLGDHGQLGIRLDNNGQALSAQEVQDKINEAIRTGNNELAQQIIGTWTTTSEEVKKRIETTGSFWDNRVYKDVTETVTTSTYKPSEFARDGERAIDTLERLGTSIITVNGAFETMNMALLEASLAGADAASRFADRFGGLDKFNAAASSYYQNFYSDSERLAKGREAVSKQLKDYGVNIDLSDPGARGKFRAEVEKNQALMVEQEANKKALRASLDGTFSGLDGKSLSDLSGQTGFTEQIKKDLFGDPNKQLSEADQERLKGLFDGLDKGSLSVEKFKDGLMDLDATLGDSGKSAEETTAGLLQAADAFAAVTLAMPDLSQVAGDLSSTITDAMLGNFKGEDVGSSMAQTVTDGIYNAIAGSFAAQISNIIVAGVVEPIVAAAITGAAVTGVVSAATIEAMVAQAQAVADAAAQILSDPAFLGALDKVNTAVSKIKIPVMRAVPPVQSYSAAVSSSGSAADSAAKAANKAAEAWRRLSDTLMDEVNRIRGLIADEGGNSLAYWQAQLATQTAMARAGDQDAAGRLTDISRSLLSAAADQASGRLELAQIRAATAQSLETTAQWAQAYAGGSATPSIVPSGGATASANLPTFTPARAQALTLDVGVLQAELRETREQQRAQAAALMATQTRITNLLQAIDDRDREHADDGYPVVVVAGATP